MNEPGRTPDQQLPSHKWVAELRIKLQSNGMTWEGKEKAFSVGRLQKMRGGFSKAGAWIKQRMDRLQWKVS